MNTAAILNSHCSDNNRFTNMWIKAFDFWDIQYSKVCVDDLNIEDLRSFEVLLITGMEHISDIAYRMLDRYILSGGKILISGDLPNGFSKYFNGMKVKKLQRSNVHRCIRIKKRTDSSNGMMEKFCFSPVPLIVMVLIILQMVQL